MRRYFVFYKKKCRIYAAFGVSQTPIREAVRKELGGLTAGKHAYRIGFIDVHKQEQETELDTDSVRDLEELWASLAPEFECAEDSITYMAPAFENDPENDFNKDFL